MPWSDHDARPYLTDHRVGSAPQGRRAIGPRRVAAAGNNCVASPFRRCLQTAAGIVEKHGCVRVVIDDRLGEYVKSVQKDAAKHQDCTLNYLETAHAEVRQMSHQCSHLRRVHIMHDM